MKVLISAGGTGGHINPAIDIGKCILEYEQNAEVLYISSKGKLEEKLYSGTNYRLFEAKGLSRKNIFKNFGILYEDYQAYKEIKKVIKEFKPDVGVGAGGYISAIAMMALKTYHIPFIIHEQNAIPGFTTKVLSNYSKRHCLAFMSAKEHLHHQELSVLTGNPVRKDLLTTNRQQARKKLGFSEEEKIVLCFGGSLGSEKLNEVFYDIIKLCATEKKFTVIVGTGGIYYEDVMGWIREDNLKLNEKIIIKKYIDNMTDILNAADLAITRSGAMSVSEIAAVNIPSILIPSPNVTADHQTKNAMELENCGGAEIITEKNLKKDLLFNQINSIINDNNKFEAMKEALKKIAITDGDKRVYLTLKEVIK